MGTLMILVLLVGCGSGDPETSPLPQQQAAVSAAGPHVITPDGRRIRLEVASNDPARARGLMFRESLPDDRGMLFLFREDDLHSFWMKNTLIPLDMIWLQADGTIAHIETGVPPCTADPCPSYGADLVSRHVLELSSGGAGRYNLKVGDRLQIEGIDSYAIE